MLNKYLILYLVFGHDVIPNHKIPHLFILLVYNTSLHFGIKFKVNQNVLELIFKFKNRNKLS